MVQNLLLVVASNDLIAVDTDGTVRWVVPLGDDLEAEFNEDYPGIAVDRGRVFVTSENQLVAVE